MTADVFCLVAEPRFLGSEFWVLGLGPGHLHEVLKGTFLTLMTRKSADDESKAPLYRVMMVERLEPKRFPTFT